MKTIRQLLENLIILSLDQEKLMEDISKTNINDPKYLMLIQQQRKIKVLVIPHTFVYYNSDTAYKVDFKNVLPRHKFIGRRNEGFFRHR
ncbi:MAG: hypothetical protein N2Z60_06325, partial [Elusimicrobiales bacterium]|nr:hypothetical protein [Elusimicrobiales bacterium]